MRTPMVVVMAGVLGLAAGCGNVSEKPKDAAPGDDSTVPPIDAPLDAAVLPACETPVSGTTISFRSIGQVTGAAVLATAPRGDSRLFVVERSGGIRIFKNETLTPTLFIDLADVVTGGDSGNDERGLLGLAFHPAYANNGQFFVYYTGGVGSLRDIVARCSVSATDPDRANATCTEVLSIADFAGNHNGGMIEFGSDGFLYVSTGDGGNANDPQRTAQNVNSLLGKMLRIDIDNKQAGKEYGIPPTNPFAGGGGAPEIFMMGLRNPWRWSFDRVTGDMWIGDVGQAAIEELDYVKAADLNGGPGTPVNFGWSQYEGTNAFNGPSDPAGKTMPVHQRIRSTGWASITGGDVYRGTCYPDIVGHYFFGDFVAGRYARAIVQNGTVMVSDLTGTLPASPTSLHADARGELYLTAISGRVFRLEARP